MKVVGLDLSLTATGVADADGTAVLKTKMTGIERLIDLREAVLQVIGLPRIIEAQSSVEGLGGRLLVDPESWPILVVIEGYSMGTARQNSHAHALGELGGVIRVALTEHSIEFVDVPPASLKKYATGKGNANKGMVLEAASKRSGLDFGGDDNRADAWWLRAMALDYLGDPIVTVPALNRGALAAVAWPELAVAS